MFRKRKKIEYIQFIYQEYYTEAIAEAEFERLLFKFITNHIKDKNVFKMRKKVISMQLPLVIWMHIHTFQKYMEVGGIEEYVKNVPQFFLYDLAVTLDFIMEYELVDLILRRYFSDPPEHFIEYKINEIYEVKKDRIQIKKRDGFSEMVNFFPIGKINRKKGMMNKVYVRNIDYKYY